MADAKTKKPELTPAEARAKFVEVANKRSRSAVKAISNVAKLPTKARKPSDAATIIGVLRKAVDQCEAYLSGSAPAEEAIIKE